MNIAKRLLVLLLALLLLSGCARVPTHEPYQVAVIVKSSESEFFKSVFAGANAAASEYNLQLTILAPETEEDAARQNTLVRMAITAQVDAIVFSAVSYQENAPAIDEAVEAGIQVVVIDSDVNSPGVSARIGTDNVEAGRMTARAALNSPEPELVVGIVNYSEGSRNGQEREEGFRLETAGNPRIGRLTTINVLAEQEDARQKTVELLRENPQINTLVAFNEPTCVGAALAVQDLALQGKIRMVGFDSNLQAVELMQQGIVSALIVQNPYAMGYLGVETAWQLLTGKIRSQEEFRDTSTVVVERENMFSIECQKALFTFQ